MHLENKTLRQMNIEIYGPICMAGYKVSRYNPLTMHHIIALKDGGKSIFENSSNISNLAHCGIHIVSNDDLVKAKKIIDYLFYFKEHPEFIATRQFAEWLKQEIINLEYTETMSRDKLLIYKRRNKK
jgi:hypothetical protein